MEISRLSWQRNDCWDSAGTATHQPGIPQHAYLLRRCRAARTSHPGMGVRPNLSTRATQVNSAGQDLKDAAIRPERRMPAGEMLLLACSVISLLASCVLWSSHKQPWMDEIFTWN